MSDDPKSDLKPEIRQLPQAMNLFLKRAMPAFTVESCAEAFILALAKLFPVSHLLGYLWEPARQTSHRTRFTLESGQVVREREPSPPVEIFQREDSDASEDHLKLVLHPSLKSLQSDPSERRTLETKGCKAAVEIHFAYYNRPILRVILGLSNAKSLPTVEAQDFLLVFCRCCLVSVNGAYLAELDEREGRREKPEPSERFNLTLQWFHALVRHLNIAIVGIQNGKTAESEDALERATIVAGICLAEMLALIGKIQP
ncbi:MAG TPA: hypothetical protein VK775_02370 [Chthoniobacterales bacterium]|jgi:hypothetical protein|nr:hypothetical protein [Chthoniobacterales bacterium]